MVREFIDKVIRKFKLWLSPHKYYFYHFEELSEEERMKCLKRIMKFGKKTN